LGSELFPSAKADARKEQELRDRVRRHKIHWQAWPEYHVCGSERRQVGFRLGLLGTHDRPSTRPISGCPESWKVYTSLHELARWVLPQEQGEGDLQVSVDDASLVYQGDRRDIMVTIKIARRQGFDQPVDARDVRCLAAMEERLLGLGALQDQEK
jgi:hypothetical protein